MTKAIELGDRAKDSISGLSGIVVGKTDYLYGCRRIGLQPEKMGKDGKPQDTYWFDEPQVKRIAGGIVKAVTPLTPKQSWTGGPARSGDTSRR